MAASFYENPDLKRERQSCNFDKDEITNLIDGNVEKTKYRRELVEYILSDPSLKDPIPVEYLSHEEKYAAELKKACLLVQKMREPVPKEAKFETLRKRQENGKPLDIGVGPSSVILKEGNALGLHFVMFIPAIIGQGSTEQQNKWLPRALNLEIIGTYAQTELGHGTFLRGLETKATYDPDTKEFILETPSLSAYKWWPGGLGKTSNYAVVMAQLYTKGKCEGIHPFLVQLRDETTHEPLPGISVGEIGPKLGLNSNDNGYLGFDRVRIPRDQLLMKHSQVLEDGTYVKPKSTKLGYATMVYVRVFIVQDMAQLLRKAVTIATRYSCVRHQSELKPGEPEPQILDYKAQQNKLFPALAASFAFHFAAEKVWNLYHLATENIGKGDLQMLPDLHGMSCAMKALSTSETAKFVETLRQSCGGHGYMVSSGFPRLYGIATASETYEGENTVLWLQVARYLIKTRMDGSGGQSVAYLIGSNLPDNKAVDLSLDGIINLFQRVAAGYVDLAMKELAEHGRQGMAPYDAWNHSAVQLIKAAQAHARYLVADCFVRSVKEDKLSGPVRSILNELCEFLLIYWLVERSGDFFMFAELKTEHLSQLQAKYMELLSIIRGYAVNVVDSFDIRDEALGSVLGCWDGNAYQRLFDEALKSPLNRNAVHRESFEKYLKPLMKSKL